MELSISFFLIIISLLNESIISFHSFKANSVLINSRQLKQWNKFKLSTSDSWVIDNDTSEIECESSAGLKRFSTLFPLNYLTMLIPFNHRKQEEIRMAAEEERRIKALEEEKLRKALEEEKLRKALEEEEEKKKTSLETIVSSEVAVTSEIKTTSSNCTNIINH